ncbi:toxin of the YeeV-YeeU toxin-antitoxin system, partial [Escherichia coli O104:H4 str. E112/10]
ACGIRLCLKPAHRIKLTLRDAAVRVFLFHHPLQPGFALRVQHFTAVQAVGDGDVVFLILIRVA